MKQCMEKDGRLLSLDALRGFDMFFIMGGGSLLLAVASFFPGDCAAALAEQMGHKEWHGFAFYDLIFPLFLFLAGVSFPFSLHKQLSVGKDRAAISLKCIKRGFMLILLGVLYNGLSPAAKNRIFPPRCRWALSRTGETNRSKPPVSLPNCS